ncbi:membrane-associated progesterone receptor component 2 [Clonorchis sinensis]|uniref:Membrane-associated progesterone receptor component 2 n=1 Tax=Clonorchis sinensis TaxID=79923 RepID=G7YBS1_CLOSI|nr:membrane-associated progesterone receptor component 2 [Clonorchis sinensis]
MSYGWESFGSWILIIISVICMSAGIIAIVYHALRRRRSSSRTRTPKLPMRDFTLEELQQFDGNGPDGRILLAVNGNVFDVTENGQNFYGKGRILLRYSNDYPSQVHPIVHSLGKTFRGHWLVSKLSLPRPEVGMMTFQTFLR